MSLNIFGLFRRILSFFWRLITWVRNGLANLIFLVIILVIIVSLSPKEVRQMPDNIALRIAPSGFLVDQYSYTDPLTQILNSNSDQQLETRVRDLVTAIENAAGDERITSLVLELGDLFGGGLSKLQEVGSALKKFKQSGKPIYAVGDNYTQEQYFLASFADEVVMHPMGAIILTGYGSYQHYFKEALDKLSLNMHVFRVGEYKDAVEPFLLDEMSDASREHNSQWLNELWSSYTATVEEQRALKAGTLNNYINQMDVHLQQHGGNSASAAQAIGIVDTLADHLQQQHLLINLLGKDKKQDRYRALDYRSYLHYVERETVPSEQSIGLIVARGMILDGEQPQGSIGSDTLAELIRNARKNNDIKALVIRIDSGGGSAFASEVIRKELETVRQSGLPVLVSMGSVAASGGYWMSMGADQVWATPNTITGSIGVFSAFPTIESSLEKLGINSDGVGTTKLAGALRLDRPMTPLAENIMQQSVNNIYQQFLNLVAQARNSNPDDIHTVAQGRVWTGATAKRLGLVDELGDLQDVIDAAAKAAGLAQYDVIEVEKPLTPAEQLAQQLAGNLAVYRHQFAASGSTLEQMLASVARQLQPPMTLLQMNDPRSIYAQCLECPAL